MKKNIPQNSVRLTLERSKFNKQRKNLTNQFRLILLSIILLITGTKDGYSQCDSWILVRDSAEWTARAGLQAVNMNNDFYIMGGRTPRPPGDVIIQGDSDIWNDVWKSSDYGKTWNQIHSNDSSTSHWPARAYFQALTKADTMFILGGQNFIVEFNPFDSSLVSTSDFFNDVWASTDGIQWNQLSDSAGWTGRAGLSAVVFKNEIYVMGGSTNDDAAVIGGPPSRIYYNDVWKSGDGVNWTLLTDSAAWSKRAGGIAVVKDDHIYMIGGEEGFLCLPGSPCPPYFNDVWRSRNGKDWELVTAEAPWSKRPGHQVVVTDNKFVLFGGFGFNPENQFIPANPVDTWISSNGKDWQQLQSSPWNAIMPAQIKYDFDALVAYDNESQQNFIYTFGGDRETFNFMDPTNHLNIDNDVWKFCANGSVIVNIDLQKVIQKNWIYPNPFVNQLLIRTNEEEIKILLTNVQGKTLIDKRVTVENDLYELNGLHNLTSGIYFLQIQGVRNQHTMKLIKN